MRYLSHRNNVHRGPDTAVKYLVCVNLTVFPIAQGSSDTVTSAVGLSKLQHKRDSVACSRARANDTVGLWGQARLGPVSGLMKVNLFH